MYSPKADSYHLPFFYGKDQLIQNDSKMTLTCTYSV